jgi:hypothetical protein
MLGKLLTIRSEDEIVIFGRNGKRINEETYMIDNIVFPVTGDALENVLWQLETARIENKFKEITYIGLSALQTIELYMNRIITAGHLRVARKSLEDGLPVLVIDTRINFDHFHFPVKITADEYLSNSSRGRNLLPTYHMGRSFLLALNNYIVGTQTKWYLEHSSVLDTPSYS